MKVTKVKAEPKTISTAVLYASAMLPRRCLLSNKLSNLFELFHARQFRTHFHK